MRKKMRKHLILPSALLIVLLLCGTVSASAEAAGAAGDGNAAEETAEAAEATETAEESDGAETEAPAEEVQPDCSSWAVEEVREAIAEGLVPEHLQSDYQQPVTRGELAELTAYYVLWHEPEGTTMEEVWAGKDEYYAQRRADESTMDPEYYRSYAENVFTDINEEFFNRMYQFHYISGYPDGTFRPEEPVSRQNAAVLLWQAMHLYRLDYPSDMFEQTLQIRNRFRDYYTVGSWASSSVDHLVIFGCLNGVSEDRFAPAELITKEQAIAVILRMTEAEQA